MDRIEKLRNEIDQIDQKLIELLEQRAKTAKEIGDEKLLKDVSVYQPEREKAVIEKVQKKSDLLKKSNIQAIWREIISACKEVQGHIIKVSYLGPEGTNTYSAALSFFPKSGTEFVESNTIFDVFREIESDKVDLGVLPIENSLQGMVRETMDLLIDKNLKIYSEIEIRIMHNLIGLKDTQLKKINAIYSHPQAISQTMNWIRNNIPNAEIIKTNSTAQAIKKVAKMGDATKVAIGTEIAAKLNNLEIIVSGIEDNTSNYTRFYIISKKENVKTEGDYKTSLVFVTKHVPGALFNVLKIFADDNINLMKIESRPRRQGLWEYIFLMDFEGHPDDAKIKDALEKMKESTVWYKILGSYVPRTVNKK